MKTFTSLSDLDKLSEDDPAKPVVKQLLTWLIPATLPSSSSKHTDQHASAQQQRTAFVR